MNMDRETIIKLALKAGVEWHGVHAEPDGDKTLWKGDIEHFAKLVAEHSASVEREACAKVCDELSDKHTWEGCYADECATAIRARGNT